MEQFASLDLVNALQHNLALVIGVAAITFCAAITTIILVLTRK